MPLLDYIWRTDTTSTPRTAAGASHFPSRRVARELKQIQHASMRMCVFPHVRMEAFKE